MLPASPPSVTRRILAYAPTAAILLAALARCTSGWGDATGYFDAGLAFRAGAYSQDWRNTWPPFFSLAAVPISLLADLPPVPARLLWASITSAALIFSMVRFWRAVRPEGAPWWAAPLAAFLVAPFWAHHLTYHQVYALVLAAALQAFLDAARGRDVRAGLWLGLAVSLKVTPAVALLYFVAKRRFRLAAVCGLTMAACALSTAPVLGLRGAVDAHVRWLQVADGTRGPRGVRNQSVMAFAERWLSAEPRTDPGGPDGPRLAALSPRTADLVGRVLSAVLVVATLAALVALDVPVLEAFAPLTAVSVLASPMCWRNQLIALFPLLLVVLARLRDRRVLWLALPFLVTAVEREPGLVGVRAFQLLEGAGLTTVTCVLLLFAGLRAAAAQNQTR